MNELTKRINLAVTSIQYDYISTMSKMNEESMSKFILDKIEDAMNKDESYKRIVAIRNGKTISDKSLAEILGHDSLEITRQYTKTCDSQIITVDLEQLKSKFWDDLALIIEDDSTDEKDVSDEIILKLCTQIETREHIREMLKGE